MKKIMFNDQYGLTEAVLDGRKTRPEESLMKSLSSISIAAVSSRKEKTRANSASMMEMR